MAFKFLTSQRRFLTQQRNGEDFLTNPTTDFTDEIQGNVGDLVRLSEIIQVEVWFNESESITVTYSESGLLGQLEAPGFDFKQQGFFAGADIQIFVGTEDEESSISSISGVGNSKMLIDKTNLTDLLEVDNEYDNLIIRLKTPPTAVQYKYGLVKNTVLAPTPDNYLSPLDSNVQGYYENAVGLIFGPMSRIGSFESWDLTDDLQIKRIASIGTYTHQYEIQHDFYIQFYDESQETNIETGINPTALASDCTYQYVSGYFIGAGGSSGYPGAFEQLPTSGNVGYYNENFNGLDNDFIITSLTITNTSATGTIEADEVNSINAVINATTGTPFDADQRVIVGLYRLPSVTEYSNNANTFKENFLFDSKYSTVSAGPVASTIITAFDITFTSSTEIEVDFDATYTADEQAKITEGDRFVIWVSVGDQNLTPSIETWVNLLFTDTFTHNTDISGIITDWAPLYYNSFNAYSGTRFYSDWKGWDGDLMGFRGVFKLNQLNDGNYYKIDSMLSRIIAYNTVTEAEIQLSSKNLILGDMGTFASGGYLFQILDSSYFDTFHLPIVGEDLNINSVDSTPTYAPTFQTVIVKSFERIPHRDWIFNAFATSEFFDVLEPQNGQNEETSRYQTFTNWEILHELTVDVTLNVPAPSVGESSVTIFDPTITTQYKLRSDHFDILDFGDAGGTGFSSVTKYFNTVTGEERTDISANKPTRIEVTVSHGGGVLPLSEWFAVVWIEAQGTNQIPYWLHTDKAGWNLPENPLVPTNIVTSTNFEFLEITTAAGEFTLICQTNPDFILDGVTYNVYDYTNKKIV